MRLFLKSRKNISYRERILERFQLAKLKTEEVDTWVHAVSLGEVVAATQLIESLLKADKKVLITTMTPAGSKQVTSKFADKVLHQYVPYDLPWCVKRFFRAYKPKTGVIMETELWPNLLYFANLFGVKLGLVNARISDKAFKQYQKTGKIFKPVLANFSFIGAQSELDAKRFISLGAHESVVSVAGNVKFDITHPGKKLQDFSESKYMSLIVCEKEADEAKKTRGQIQIEKAHLHDNIGDVVHVEQKDAKWKDLFENIHL